MIHSLISDEVVGSKRCERQTGDHVMPSMRQNSCAQAASKDCKQAEEHAEHCEQYHISYSLISMRRTEDQRRKRHARSHSALCPCSELTLQIPAKYDLFNQSRDQAEQYPACNFRCIRGRKLLERAYGLLLLWSRLKRLARARGSLPVVDRDLNSRPQDSESAENRQRSDPEQECNSQIERDAVKSFCHVTEE